MYSVGGGSGVSSKLAKDGKETGRIKSPNWTMPRGCGGNRPFPTH